jgi:hypothetical protein
LVHQHRFLRSSHIVSLVSGNHRAILRRLQLLYHHGYLERPRCQIDYYHAGGSREIVYGLGNKSHKLLRQRGTPVRNDWGEKNRTVKRVFLEHALGVSDFMVALELCCRRTGVAFLNQTDLNLKRLPRWKVKVKNGLTLTVIPDRVFALEHPQESTGRKRVYFFLEADRGTMPVKRGNLFQTSFYRKFLAYEAGWRARVHETQFKFSRLRVLIVTTKPERVENLMKACAKLKAGRGLFLFSDEGTLAQSEDVFSAKWRNVEGVTVPLFE